MKSYMLFLSFLTMVAATTQAMESPVNTAKDFDPIIVDAPQKINLIDSFIRSTAQQAGIQNISYTIMPKSFKEDTIYSLNLYDDPQPYLGITQKNFKKLQAALENQAPTLDDIQFLNSEKSIIFHELGHIADEKDRQQVTIEPRRKRAFALSSTLLVGVLLHNYFEPKNLSQYFSWLSKSLILSLLVNGAAKSLYSQTWESRADNFSIKKIRDPNLLSALTQQYKKRYETYRDRKYFIFDMWNQPIPDQLLFFFGLDSHPSDYSRYKKFKKAYKKSLQRKSSNLNSSFDYIK